MPEAADAKVLALDFGLRRIGVAVGSRRFGTTRALHTVGARDGEPDWAALTKVVQTWTPQLIVVGLPLNMDGGEGESAARAMAFGKEAGRRFEMEVRFADERLSSYAADQALDESAAGGRNHSPKKRKAMRDNLAAELILRTFFAQDAN